MVLTNLTTPEKQTLDAPVMKVLRVLLDCSAIQPLLVDLYTLRAAMGDQVQILNGCTLEAMLMQPLADGLEGISAAGDRLGWDLGCSKPMLQ